MQATLRREIERNGPISFARFMELALYDPRAGYYTRDAAAIGPGGDYVTAADAGRGFGRSLARQILEIDRRLGRLEPFEVVEFGSGRGLLARDVLDAASRLAPELASRLRYTLVDRSPAMRERSTARVPEAVALAPEQVEGGREGLVVAVELFDALPVHRLRRRGGRLIEVLVTLDRSGVLVEAEGTPAPEIAALAERYGAAAEEGSEAEVSPLAPSQLDALAGVLRRGVVIVVDYGDLAERLYRPPRPRGTLLAYHRHATNERYLERPGRQDLTAHVNFSQLIDRARESGLAVLGLTTQDRFLIANGILEEFEQPDEAAWRDPSRVKRRLQALQLVHPAGMGRAFKVLVLSKGCHPPPELDGVSDPFARDA